MRTLNRGRGLWLKAHTPLSHQKVRNLWYVNPLPTIFTMHPKPPNVNLPIFSSLLYKVCSHGKCFVTQDCILFCAARQLRERCTGLMVSISILELGLCRPKFIHWAITSLVYPQCFCLSAEPAPPTTSPFFIIFIIIIIINTLTNIWHRHKTVLFRCTKP